MQLRKVELHEKLSTVISLLAGCNLGLIALPVWMRIPVALLLLIVWSWYRWARDKYYSDFDLAKVMEVDAIIRCSDRPPRIITVVDDAPKAAQEVH
jgi:hypothetical protein